MAIDADKETLVSFTEAGKLMPGKAVSTATLHRWRHNGVRGCKLETILVGGLRYTSLEAIQRFIEAQNDESTGASMTPAQKKRQQVETSKQAGN